MLRSRFLVRGSIGLLATGLMVAACSETTAPEDVAVLDSRPAYSVDGESAIWCPNDEVKYVQGLIDSHGGSLVLEGNRVDIPAGAVKSLTFIQMVLPVSDHLEVDLTAGTSGHGFQFRKPVSVTLDYSQCGSTATGLRTAWYVDSQTGEFLEAMPTADDLTSQQVTFTTPHFSVFVVAD